MRKANLIVLIISSIIFLLLTYHAYINKTGWFKEEINSLALLIILFFLSKKLKITPLYLSLISIGLILNGFGTFKFYVYSPVPIQYDRVTHFIGLFAATLPLLNYFEETNSLKTKQIIIITIIMAFGIGSFIELSEYVSATTNKIDNPLNTAAIAGPIFGQADYDINVIGPDPWVNTMQDMLFNLFGILFAIPVYYSKRLIKRLKT